MDSTREHLLGRILLERRVLAEEDLRRAVGERDDLIRRGSRITLAQLLVRERRLDPAAYAQIQSEIELRGRACYACRRAYLVAPGGPPLCPQCGGPALLPALLPAAPSPTSSESDYSPSGRFPPISPSGRFSPPSSAPSSSARLNVASSTNGRGNVFGSMVPAAPSGSSRLIPSLIVSPHGLTPNSGHIGSTDAGSHGSNGGGNGTKQGTELKTLGPYDLLTELGRGGMGVVYKAKHQKTQQIVALKVLLSGEFASPKMLLRFKEEAAVVQKLEHPNVVPIFEVGEIDGINYFTMKFVEGDLFQALLKGRGLSARRGAEIVRDVARGAHHAHETGIVHRDLKPANVIVERESGTPFIMDFGLAKDLDDDKGLSKTGVAIGTPYYMPPEQAQGKHREIDPRSDVYALGAILYEVLARKVPFNAESQTLLLRKIVEEEPIPPSQIRQGVPPDLETIALKALKKRKEDRYASAEAFAKDIERALDGQPIKAKRDPFYTPLVRKLKKNPKVIAIVAITLVVLASAIVYAVHVYRESERLKKEDELRKQQAELDQKRREQEEADLKRRTEAESWIGKGHAKRLQARLSPNFPAARATLEDAIEAFGNAIKLTDDNTEARFTALYERALCVLATHRKDLIPGALEDLKTVAASKTSPARARLALGVAALRRDHEPAKARDEFEMGKTAGQPLDPTAKRDEEAASLICRAYMDGIDGVAAAAIKRAQEAAPKSDDLFVEAGAAESWLRTQGVTGPSTEAGELERLTDKLVTIDKWHYWLHCDRLNVHALIHSLAHASESIQAGREVAPDLLDIKLIDAWIRSGLNPREGDALKQAMDAARREQPNVAAFWDALDRRYQNAAAVLKKIVENKKAAQQEKNPDKPAKKNHALWADITFSMPDESRIRMNEIKSSIGSGKVDEAVLALKKLADDFPECGAFKVWLALLHAESRRGAEARALVDSVLARTPGDPFALTVKAVTEQVLGDSKASRAAFDKVIAENKELRTPRMLFGQLLKLQADYATLETVVKPLVQEDSSDVDAAILLSTAWIHLEKPEALALAQKIADIRPKSVEAQQNLSVAFRKLKKFDDALRVTDAALKAIGDNFFLQAERAFDLWLLKRHDEAEEAAKKARALADPEELKQLEAAFSEVKAKYPKK